jgi:hypothetical protein
MTDAIDSLVTAFTADLAGLIRKAALESVHEALGKTTAPEAHAPAARAKPAGPAQRAAKSASTAKPSKAGAKRDPKVLAALVERLHGYIKATPSQRIEQIKAGLGAETRDLVLPVKRLLAAKRITSKGVKRSTTYTAAAASNGGLVLVKKRKKATAEATPATASAQ